MSHAASRITRPIMTFQRMSLACSIFPLSPAALADIICQPAQAKRIADAKTAIYMPVVRTFSASFTRSRQVQSTPLQGTMVPERGAAETKIGRQIIMPIRNAMTRYLATLNMIGIVTCQKMGHTMASSKQWMSVLSSRRTCSARSSKQIVPPKVRVRVGGRVD
jgi:hypothetical protein